MPEPGMLEVCFFLSEQTPEPPGATEEEAGCGPEAEIQRGGENHGAEGKSRPHLARRGILRVIPFHTYSFPASLSPTFHPPKKIISPQLRRTLKCHRWERVLARRLVRGMSRRSFSPLCLAGLSSRGGVAVPSLQSLGSHGLEAVSLPNSSLIKGGFCA